MFLRAAIARVTISDKYKYEYGAGKENGNLIAVDVVLGEQDRASSCQLSIIDPGLKIANELLKGFQKVGGILVPYGLFAEVSSDPASTVNVVVGGNASAYIKKLETLYGASDLSGLTERGKRCFQALQKPQVRAFLNAIAVAELGEAAAAKGGYGYLFGDVGGKETFDPRKLNDHPNQKRSAGGLTSTATGRYQTLNLVWNDDSGYGRSGLGLKDFKPISQEILAVGRMLFREILDDVEAGRIEQAIQGSGFGKGARYEWASLEGNPYGQGTKDGKRSVFLSNYNRFLKEASQGTQTAQTVQNTPVVNKPPEQIVDAKSGAIIKIELGFNDDAWFQNVTYEFILTGIQGTDGRPATTQITGRQVRFLISNTPKKFGVYRNTTLRQLATTIAAKVGAILELPESVELDRNRYVLQSAENDYSLLLKVASEAGFFLRSVGTKLILALQGASDRKVEIRDEYLLPGSTWGDVASSERIVVGQTVTTTTTTNSGQTVPTNPEASVNAPIAWQVPVRAGTVLSQEFKKETHKGIDLAGNVGDPILAAATGTVTKAGWGSGQDDGLGNMVTIDHGNGIASIYGHNSKVLVKVGQRVERGQRIADMGSTGNSTGPHLHFEIYEKSKNDWTDPLDKLPSLAAAGIKSVIGALSQFQDAVQAAVVTAQQSIDNVNTTTQQIGIQDISEPADESKGIGRGFEGELNVNAMVLNSVLRVEPGAIVKLTSVSKRLGEAIAREFRVYGARHSFKNGYISSTLQIYLPVSVRQKASSTPQQGQAINTTDASGDPNFLSWLPKWKATAKKGDTVAGYPVTSGFGPRSSPGGIGSSNHKGIDVGIPSGTPLYVIAAPGETVNVVFTPNFGGAGNKVTFQYKGFEIEYLHLLPNSGVGGAAQAGKIIGKVGSTGNSTGPHLHINFRKVGGELAPSPLGYIYWAITGKAPPNS